MHYRLRIREYSLLLEHKYLDTFTIFFCLMQSSLSPMPPLLTEISFQYRGRRDPTQFSD